MTTDIDALIHAYDQFGAYCEEQWLRENAKSNYRSQFLEEGYFLQDIPAHLLERLRPFFSDKIAAPFRLNDARPGHYASGLNKKVEELLNQDNIYYGRPEAGAIEALEQILASMTGELEQQMAHRWKVCNVRSWNVRPHAKIGPNAWHTDGLARYVRKLMFYLNPPNLQNGSIEITTRKGKTMVVQAANPACILFDSPMLSHRGRPGQSRERPIIEVTLVPSLVTSTTFIYAGQNARFPLHIADDTTLERKFWPVRATPKPAANTDQRPWVRRTGSKVKGLLRTALRKARTLLAKTKTAAAQEDIAPYASETPGISNTAAMLNLGGGPHFSHPGWINLEGVGSAENPFPFTFDSACLFPVPSSSMQLVYSSHCLEHLNDETVARALTETRRVLGSEGVLLLKLPDFELARDCWKRGDHSFFAHQWGLESVSHTWASRGMADTIDTRAAMIFSGFWNEAYGDHFAGKFRNDNDAYHGPAVQSPAAFKELMQLESMHEIAKRMRELIIKNERSYTFNHQNAWSRSELTTLLAEKGLEVVSFDKDDIIKRYARVPGIVEMRDMSLYCLAKPA